MTVVGALARVDTEDAGVIPRLEAIPRVSTFDLGEPGRVGLVIEASDVDAAHQVLTGAVLRVPGVLHAWPVSVQLDQQELLG